MFQDWHNRDIHFADLRWLGVNPDYWGGDYPAIDRCVHPLLPGLEFRLEGSMHGCQLGHFQVHLAGVRRAVLFTVECNNRQREAFEEWFKRNTGHLTRLSELVKHDLPAQLDLPFEVK